MRSGTLFTSSMDGGGASSGEVVSITYSPILFSYFVDDKLNKTIKIIYLYIFGFLNSSPKSL